MRNILHRFTLYILHFVDIFIIINKKRVSKIAFNFLQKEKLIDLLPHYHYQKRT